MGGSRSTTSLKSVAVRYAPYVENAHIDMLSKVALHRNDVLAQATPYAGYVAADTAEAFFGLGYTLSSFPSLYDMFGKFMAGLDIEAIWNTVFQDTMAAHKVSDVIDIEMVEVDEGLSKDTVPEVCLAARKINAVGSSTFVIGRAMLEDRRVKQRAVLSAEIRFALLPELCDRLDNYLNWQKAVITRFALSMKIYYEMLEQVSADTYEYAVNEKLWPFIVLDYERKAISSMMAAMFKQIAMLRKRSALSTGLSVASYAATGASIGMYWGPYGAAIGAVVGAIVGAAAMLLE